MLRKGEQRGVRIPLGTMTAGLGGESVEDEPLLPKFDYYIDESDPDILVLRRQDGAFRGSLQRKRGHEGGHRGGRQGGLREADGGQRGPFGSSRRRRPKEERLTLERPYSSECAEGRFCELRRHGVLRSSAVRNRAAYRGSKRVEELRDHARRQNLPSAARLPSGLG
jgi:hypothetical protein